MDEKVARILEIINTFGRKRQRNRMLGSTFHNIIDLKKLGCENINWIHLAQDWVQ
jgi:hypothetical protein